MTEYRKVKAATADVKVGDLFSPPAARGMPCGIERVRRDDTHTYLTYRWSYGTQIVAKTNKRLTAGRTTLYVREVQS